MRRQLKGGVRPGPAHTNRRSIFVVGLRVLGQHLIDPMGDDLEDLSVIEYVLNAAIGNSRYILAMHQPSDGDDEDV